MTMLDWPIEPWTLVELVRRQAERYGEREFLRFEDGSVTSFADLDRQSTRIAHALAARGLGRGDRLLALLLNGPSFLPLLLGANKLGAVFVSVNTELKGSFLEHQIRNSAPRILAVDRELARAFAGIDLSDVACTIVVGEGDHSLDALRGVSSVPFAELLAPGPAAGSLVEPAARDLSTVIYTSGTTGPSKGVLMPHAHVVLMGYTLARRLGLGENDVYYVCMPMFHSNALFMQVVGSLLAGARAFVVRRFSPSRWLDDVRRQRSDVHQRARRDSRVHLPPTADHRDRDHGCADDGGAHRRGMGRSLPGALRGAVPPGLRHDRVNIVAYTRPEEALVPGCAGYVLEEWFVVRVVDPDTESRSPPGRWARSWSGPGYLAASWPATSACPSGRWRRGATCGSTPATPDASTAWAGSSTSTASRTASADGARTSPASRSSRSSRPSCSGRERGGRGEGGRRRRRGRGQGVRGSGRRP